MRIRLTLCLSLFFTLTSLAGNAQVVDVIVTRDGNRYEGYISKQVPGRQLIITALRTYLTTSQHDVTVQNKHLVPLASISEASPDIFPYFTSKSMIESADITVTDKYGRETTFQDAAIIESGEEVSFVSFCETNITLDWEDIKLSAKRPLSSSSGYSFYDKLILEDSTSIEGHYLEKNLRNGIIRFQLKDGTITTIRQTRAKGICHEFSLPETNLWCQIPYIDRVVLKNGSVFEGFIVSQLFGTSVSVQLRGSESVKIAQVTDIASYEKCPNPEYTPSIEREDRIQEDIVPLVPSYHLNGKTYKLLDIHSEKGYFSIVEEDEQDRAIADVGKYLAIKFDVESRTSQFKIAKITMPETVASQGLRFKKKKNKPTIPFFTESDWINDCDMNFQMNDGKTISVDLVFRERGSYAIYVEGLGKCAMITVQ